MDMKRTSYLLSQQMRRFAEDMMMDVDHWAMTHLLCLVRSTFFVDNQSHVLQYYIPIFSDLENVSSYAWRVASLANLYHELGKASRYDMAQLGGCMTSLET